ncbi:UDP-2,3-diacylglucosamine diphosphatase [Noviherbaspirillum cavernae]|uniref:UDP-2,3-diacylglucosamine hydrolase n=1 Tax=Noviherbaspirillum cavernae TaxID=2320862 RepID=A0A418X075_9BURK|nr:UDP-2,3-diacylglucosamine diphosphatase [Noviherbaspirillum cavernae]RJG05904.1 UDP-2,3-diacylglucosamine diphosphatase [Noviherbaspirillum cavernae]
MSSSAASKAQPETVALFVSDVHLQASLPRTTKAFFKFLRQHARYAKQLYLLGDLFEYWAGDDDIDDPYNKQVLQAIRQVSDAGVAVYWIAGNRDFLVGTQFARDAGVTLLPDPFMISIAGRQIALAHGDAQCTDDVEYMAFRAKVRQQGWQQEFLAMPLMQRKAIIANLRAGSREAQRSKSCEIMDVNPEAIASLFAATGASMLIHGHTHRPACHQYERDKIRYVLPDWDCDSESPRGGWLAIDATGAASSHDVDGVQR